MSNTHPYSYTRPNGVLAVHGYSMLRTTLNKDYFNSLFDEALKFGINIEGHRTSWTSSSYLLFG